MWVKVGGARTSSYDSRKMYKMLAKSAGKIMVRPLRLCPFQETKFIMWGRRLIDVASFRMGFALFARSELLKGMTLCDIGAVPIALPVFELHRECRSTVSLICQEQILTILSKHSGSWGGLAKLVRVHFYNLNHEDHIKGRPQTNF